MHKNYFVLCFASLLAAVPAHAGEWSTDEASGCQVWNNYPTPDEKIVWSGACKDGKAFGPGTLKFVQKDPQKSSALNCSFLDGKCQGAGKKIWANGDRYKGDLVDGKLSGKGTFVWASGDQYEGNFVNDEFVGEGAFKLFVRGGNEGDFANAELTGGGDSGQPDGKRYQRELREGRRAAIAAMKGAKPMRPEVTGPGRDVTGESGLLNSCRQVPPDYPAAAGPFPGWDGLITGQVKAQGLVENGVVQSVRIVSGPNIFHDAVRAAMLQYKCPGVVGPMYFLQEFNFANPQ